MEWVGRLSSSVEESTEISEVSDELLPYIIAFCKVAHYNYTYFSISRAQDTSCVTIFDIVSMLTLPSRHHSLLKFHVCLFIRLCLLHALPLGSASASELSKFPWFHWCWYWHCRLLIIFSEYEILLRMIEKMIFAFHCFRYFSSLLY